MAVAGVALLTIAAVVAAPLLIEGGPAAAGAEGAGSVEVEAQTTARIAARITEHDAAAAAMEVAVTQAEIVAAAEAEAAEFFEIIGVL